MARPSGQDCPKHKGGLFGNFGNSLISGFPKFPKFPKWPDQVDRIFQNIRAYCLEILEFFWKSGKLGARTLGGLIVTHPMTDHALRLS